MDDDKQEDDFGGFEAADPIEFVEAEATSQSLEAKPSPWASLLRGGGGDAALLPTKHTSHFTADFDKAFASQNMPTDVESVIDAVGGLQDNTADCLSPSPGEQLGVSTDENASVDSSSGHHVTQEPINHDHQRLIKEMDVLRLRADQLTDQLETTSTELTQQRERYQTLQVTHKGEMDELRQAGHITLTAIVDEYKSLSSQLLLEVREQSEKAMNTVLQDQREHIDSLLDDHESKLEQYMKDKDKEMTAEIVQLKEELNKQQQESIELAVSSEHQRGVEALNTAVQELTETYDTKMSLIQQQMQANNSEELRKQRKELLQLVADEKESGAICRKEAVETERQHAQERLDAMLKCERDHQMATRAQIVEATREDMKSYLSEQRQADQHRTRKALTSVDLFVQGASKQLTMFLSQTDDEPS